MKYHKDGQGNYLIKGKKYEMLFGSRAQVMHGTAYKTSGGLTANNLLQNKHGRIVSASKHREGKNKNKNNLLLNGYTAKKGKFGYVKVGSTRGRRRHRGGTGAPEGQPSSMPSESGFVGVNNSTLANNAQPVSMAGGKRRRSKSRRTRSRKGGALMLGGSGLKPLSPGDF